MKTARKVKDTVAAIFSGRHDRNADPILLGVTGIALLAVVMLVALSAPTVTYWLRTHAFTAEFVNAAGLAPNDPVYVAGVPAGRVESLDLAGDRVVVSFRIDRSQGLGDRSTAEVKLRTILGKRYVSVTPAGAGELVDDLIPLARTTVPYSLDELTTDAQHVADGLDVEGLEAMMHTLTEVMPPDSRQIADALAGIEATSNMLVRNDARITSLLRASKSLTSVVTAQSEDLSMLVENSTAVVSILAARKEALMQLVDDLRALTESAATFLTDNSAEIDALLVNLQSVTDTLEANAADIDLILTRLPAALRAATDAAGNGTWVDVHAPAGPLPDNFLCSIGVMEGCR
ncbi:MCE family protein [Rhodococcus chondri]|uniref:MCE family protein n=1 Tax=Rhodococcus chondri TaxID=3065941 RepID=A0ABU7JLA6_9NOCA|nr:MCE family protein [Rhodococcus sp. CC-R104]MEE2030818.1 MCE family protein [Rhodococcus sp. CC-R104]